MNFGGVGTLKYVETSASILGLNIGEFKQNRENVKLNIFNQEYAYQGKF